MAASATLVHEGGASRWRMAADGANGRFVTADFRPKLLTWLGIDGRPPVGDGAPAHRIDVEILTINTALMISHQL